MKMTSHLSFCTVGLRWTSCPFHFSAYIVGFFLASIDFILFFKVVTKEFSFHCKLNPPVRCNWSVFARQTHSTSKFDKTSMSKCVCVCVRVSVYIYTHMHTYMHAHIHTYLSTYLPIYLPACLHACIHTHTHHKITPRVVSQTSLRVHSTCKPGREAKDHCPAQPSGAHEIQRPVKKKPGVKLVDGKYWKIIWVDSSWTLGQSHRWQF